MPDEQKDVTKEKYDVIVVGSGAGGGTTAYVLAGMGLKVLMLEAGRMIDPQKDMTPHAWPWEYRFRGRGKPGQFDGLWKIGEATSHLYTNPRIDPYAEAPDMPFHWTRLRAVGGRTTAWGRASMRHGHLDFKTQSTQGYAFDWPIGYDDIAPYYDKVERLIGLNGNQEEVFNSPNGPFYLPPLKPRCGEVFLRNRAARVGVQVATTKTAVLTESHGGRLPCHYCGSCWGCQVRARFSTLDVYIPELVKKSNFTLRTNAAVYQVLVNRDGQARGVSFIDSITRQDYEVQARAVVLAGSTVESGRILLNSKSRFHPNGFANSSGVVGHYITDSVKLESMAGIVPALKGRKVVNEDGAGSSHVYIPRFDYKHEKNYQGGFMILVGGGFSDGGNSSGRVPGYGKQLKQGVRDLYGSAISLSARGEMLPDYDNYFEIDPGGMKDSLGIPQVRFHAIARDNEQKMMEAMYYWTEMILRACDAEILPLHKAIRPPGDATHEAGTARMGDDPKTSVLNKFNQSHDVKNLFINDASCFVTMPATHGITTLIMALAWRASEYLAEQMRTGAIA
jgi:choline dehydrogenase-like flavoprotein